MDGKCEGCYYKAKIERQAAAITKSQRANEQYKQAIFQKSRKIASLEKQVHDWNKVFNSMPALIRRWALWRYSKLS